MKVSAAFYQIKIRSSGYCLDVEGRSLSAGATLIAHTCRDTDNANQLWRVEAVQDGGYRLINRASGLCAVVRDNSGANGTATVQGACTPDTALLWGLYMQ